MNTPTIYTATSADLSPPVQTDSFCVDLVLATDYQKLKDEFAALAAENVVLKESRNNLAEFIHEELDADYPLNMNLDTPATDRIVAGIKADAIDEAAVELDRVDTVASTRVIGFKLREFAQQLR